ncbi:hypothetical protein ACJ73_05632 [Blastomyces percursus]|uniref:Uncharacterized protein n=1 Tax=Blastomyces percursus TaxID=1658174 RepID=A0A1J9Q305_9EURO|nr:hypothetical protein ACJ73_05632 [Blastomyces percursus]
MTPSCVSLSRSTLECHTANPGSSMFHDAMQECTLPDRLDSKNISVFPESSYLSGSSLPLIEDPNLQRRSASPLGVPYGLKRSSKRFHQSGGERTRISRIRQFRDEQSFVKENDEDDEKANAGGLDPVKNRSVFTEPSRLSSTGSSRSDEGNNGENGRTNTDNLKSMRNRSVFTEPSYSNGLYLPTPKNHSYLRAIQLNLEAPSALSSSYRPYICCDEDVVANSLGSENSIWTSGFPDGIITENKLLIKDLLDMVRVLRAASASRFNQRVLIWPAYVVGCHVRDVKDMSLVEDTLLQARILGGQLTGGSLESRGIWISDVTEILGGSIANWLL